MKIGIAQDHQVPASVRFYRTMGPVSFLEKQYPGLFQVDFRPAQYFAGHEMHVFPYDIMLIERPITGTALQIVRLCKSQGVITWVDYDDNLFQIPAYNKSRNYFSQSSNFKTVQQIMSEADLVTVSTQALKNIYAGLNKNVRVIPNTWNSFRFPLPESYSDAGTPIRMAWRGGDKHSGDLNDVRVPFQNAVNDPAFDWRLFGDRPEPHITIKDNQHIGFMLLFPYLKTLIQSSFDYLFVPLQANEFNKGKSNCSWIEATFAGAVTIAPMGFPEFDQPGVIRYKDNKHLKIIFDGIKKGKYDKRERVEASRTALMEKYHLGLANELRKNLLLEFFPVVEKVEADGTS